MSYIEYVFAAYAVFVAALTWDFVAPRISAAQTLRAARLRVTRQAAAVARADNAELRR